MRDYGVDKPDTRFGMLLHNLTPCFDASTTKSQIISSALASEGGAVLGLKLDGAGDIFDKKAVNKLQEHVRGIGVAGVITVHVQDDGSWAGFISKHVTNEEVAAVNKAFDASPGDVLVLAAGEHDHMQGMLGILRLYVTGPHCFYIYIFLKKYSGGGWEGVSFEDAQEVTLLRLPFNLFFSLSGVLCLSSVQVLTTAHCF